MLSNVSEQFGEVCPRYLEDFVEMYGKSGITIMSYGKLHDEAEYINNLVG